MNGEVLLENDCHLEEEYINVYTDSLMAHKAEETYIPIELYKNGCFIITVNTNNSQPGQLSYEQKYHLIIHLKFAQCIPKTQVVYVNGCFIITVNTKNS